MFTDSGSQIKSVASTLFVITTLIMIVLGLWVMFAVSVILGLVALILAVISAYVQCLFLAAFGDLVEQNAWNAEINARILELLESENESKYADKEMTSEKNASDNGNACCEKPTVEQSAVPVHEDDGMITCPKCGLTQRNDRRCCLACGTKFSKE